jgi:hypothetical protein
MFRLLRAGGTAGTAGLRGRMALLAVSEAGMSTVEYSTVNYCNIAPVWSVVARSNGSGWGHARRRRTMQTHAAAEYCTYQFTTIERGQATRSSVAEFRCEPALQRD